MDIDSFIEHYRPEWDRLEQACARGGRGLAKRTGPEIDELVRLYLRASAHLAEVRTRYRDPRLEAYLNRVVGVAPASLSTFIFINNVRVALLSFVAGLALGVGSIYFVAQNGLLLGTLAGAYQAAGKAGIFWPLILPHGLLELTAICIASGAGLRMGWSLIEPGDRTRGQSLVAEARDAVFVMVGVVPAFGVAALIEGFITPSGINHVLSITLGVVVVAAYVVVLFVPLRRPTKPAPALPPLEEGSSILKENPGT